MLYIENEGALFRGPARGLPEEVWSSSERRFVPYKQAGQIKPIDWGHVITEPEAQAMMKNERRAVPSAEERPDLYDGYDCQEPKTQMSQAYLDRVMPEHVKKRIAERYTPAAAPSATPEADSDEAS